MLKKSGRQKGRISTIDEVWNHVAMPENKNQHYVPVAHLSRFSLNGKGDAICLFNLGSGRCVEIASVGSQCSEDYFYCQDDRNIREIKEVEAPYGAAVNLLVQGASLSDGSALALRRFMVFQHLRTKFALERGAEILRAMKASSGFDMPDMNDREMLDASIKAFIAIFNETVPEVADLEICIIRNGTEVPFVTSDHPSILTNPYHAQTKRVRFGLGSAGALLVLPLSPDLLVLLYDRDVYAIGSNDRILELNKPDDVDAFNDIQLLNCNKNVYFRDWQHRDYVKERGQQTMPLRPALFQTFDFVLHEKDGRLVPQQPSDFGPGDEGHIDGFRHILGPQHWFTFLRVRPDATAWRTRKEGKLLRGICRGQERYKGEAFEQVSL